ncbi:MAG: hypothetical protein DI535_25235 [Citrobacter freundii]|nr:MAG: hypothetical protein DI535_25235 [Citrobacter freundii]
MAFIPNIHFTALIKIEGRLKEFNFRKRAEDVYDADTADDRGNRWQFKWKKGPEGWEIVSLTPTLPTWIANNKAIIEEAFMKQPEVNG